MNIIDQKLREAEQRERRQAETRKIMAAYEAAAERKRKEVRDGSVE